MTIVPFDTLKLATMLEQSGFTPQQAKGAASALGDAFAEGVPTKSDLANMESLLRSDIANLESILRSEFRNTGNLPRSDTANVDRLLRSDLARMATKEDLSDLKAEMTRWMFAQTFVIIGTVTALNHFFH